MKKLFIIILLFFVPGCISMPDRENFEYGACYDAALCRYFSARGNYPIDCGEDAETCQKMRTLQDCSKAAESIPGLTFQSCWDKLR